MDTESREPQLLERFLAQIEQDYGAWVREQCRQQIAKLPVSPSYEQMAAILDALLDACLDRQELEASLDTPFSS